MAWKCIYGNDAELMDWMECDECGSITLIDNSDPKCLEPDQGCPVCAVVEKSHWKILLLKEIQGNARDLVEAHRRIGTL